MAVGVITGSGTHALPGFDGSQREVLTPFGPASVTQGSFAGSDIVHVSRHGPGHRRLSNQVTHRANIAALRACGAEAILAVTVCGGLDPELALGTLIVFDDLYFLANRLPDGSLCTLHTEPGAVGRGHWVFDRPFSRPLRSALIGGGRDAGHAAVDGGCYGHVDGPRFNTRAEIRMLRACGVTAVSQTAGPETVLAGEAQIPYALLGYVTDHANGVSAQPTPVPRLLELISASTAAFGSVLAAALGRLSGVQLEPCGTVLRFD